MEEIKPTPGNPDSKALEREQKRARARAVWSKIVDVMDAGNNSPQKKLIEFAKKFRNKYPNAGSFVLFHDLIGSTIPPEMESGPLDTEDGEIERFIREELSDIG